MKIKLIIVSLMICLNASAQFKYPTNREVYDYCIGDTFLFEYYYVEQSDIPQANLYPKYRHMFVVTDKTINKESIIYCGSSKFVSYPRYSSYSKKVYVDLHDTLMYPEPDSVCLKSYGSNWYQKNYCRIDTAYKWQNDTTKTVYEKIDNLMEAYFRKTIIPSIGMFYYSSEFSWNPVNYTKSFSLIYLSRKCNNIVFKTGDSSVLDEFLKTSAIQEVNLKFNLHPNPISTYFDIQNPNKYKLIIKDLHFKTILEIEDNQTRVETADWPAGLYFIQIIENNEIIETRKIVKE